MNKKFKALNIFNLNKRKTIYIHIGFMKTGTSAIQNFLKSNFSFLQENNFYFPPTNEKAMNYLAFSLLDEIPSFIHHTLPIDRKTLYKNLLKEIQNSKQDNIILSTEAFYLISTDYFLGDEAPIRLFDFLNKKKFNIKIIGFIRRQDEYLETQYNQHIKTHNFWNLYSKDIFCFYNEKKELFNFNKIINRWSEVFGKENIILKVYNKKSDSVLDFLKILKIKNVTNYNTNNDINPKLSFKALDFMQKANKFNIDKSTAKKNYLLVDLIENSIKETTVNYNLLNFEESESIMNDFFDENLELSNRFLNGDISWFFKKESNEFKSNLNENLTTEDCIRIATNIWNYYQKKI